MGDWVRGGGEGAGGGGSAVIGNQDGLRYSGGGDILEWA